MASALELYGVMRAGSVSTGLAYDLKLQGLSVALSKWLLTGGISWVGVCSGVQGVGGGIVSGVVSSGLGEGLFLSGLVSGGLVGGGLVYGGVGGALGGYTYRVGGVSGLVGSGVAVFSGGVYFCDELSLRGLIVSEFKARGVYGLVGEEGGLARGLVGVMSSLSGLGSVLGVSVVPVVSVVEQVRVGIVG